MKLKFETLPLDTGSKKRLKDQNIQQIQNQAWWCFIFISLFLSFFPWPPNHEPWAMSHGRGQPSHTLFPSPPLSKDMQNKEDEAKEPTPTPTKFCPKINSIRSRVIWSRCHRFGERDLQVNNCAVDYLFLFLISHLFFFVIFLPAAKRMLMYISV